MMRMNMGSNYRKLGKASNKQNSTASSYNGNINYFQHGIKEKQIKMVQLMNHTVEVGNSYFIVLFVYFLLGKQ